MKSQSKALTPTTAAAALILLAAAVLIIPSSSQLPNLDATCTAHTNDLNPCLNYLRAEVQTPSADCCSAAVSLISACDTPASRQTACYCMLKLAPQKNVTLPAAQNLPSNCGFSFQYTISPDLDCSKIV